MCCAALRSIAAQQIGIAKGCLYDIALPYLMERKQFGSAIGDFQGMQHQYAQVATEIHAAEVMMYNACRLKETGLEFVKEASMVKLFSSQVAERAASKTIEWLGGIGFTKDLLAEKMYRDCKVSYSPSPWTFCSLPCFAAKDRLCCCYAPPPGWINL
jgi:short-chain 2-methylacyl-CoA dehydrogenase